MSFIDQINYQIKAFGFADSTDVLVSTLHTDKNWLHMGVVGSVLGSLALFLEKYVGLEPVAYIAFLSLLIIEFVTGIKASIKSGRRIESRKFGRMIIKIGIYTSILSIVNIMKGVFNKDAIDIYYWLYYIIFNLVVIQLVISVFENLAKLGYAESSVIVRIMRKKLNKWFDLTNDPDHEDYKI